MLLWLDTKWYEWWDELTPEVGTVQIILDLCDFMIYKKNRAVLSFICREYISITPVDAWNQKQYQTLYILCIFPVYTHTYDKV